ncbi:hypothetical protein K438DRAFT_1780512 [Mycena galopus ATCC 62051]|nr:hypothetical protein K438DRAFT_1780512 [Mycena galopus ATCC 62051]
MKNFLGYPPVDQTFDPNQLKERSAKRNQVFTESLVVGPFGSTNAITVWGGLPRPKLLWGPRVVAFVPKKAMVGIAYSKADRPTVVRFAEQAVDLVWAFEPSLGNVANEAREPRKKPQTAADGRCKARNFKLSPLYLNFPAILEEFKGENGSQLHQELR